MLLNALKKPEYQSNPEVYDDWYYLCNYIKKNNCTILAEVIAVANKIERGLYQIEDLDEIRAEFEQITAPTQTDSSFKSIYGFIQDAVEFYKYKSKPRIAKPTQRQPNDVNMSTNKSINSRTSMHKYSRSRGCVFIKPVKKDDNLVASHAANNL